MVASLVAAANGVGALPPATAANRPPRQLPLERRGFLAGCRRLCHCHLTSPAAKEDNFIQGCDLWHTHGRPTHQAPRRRHSPPPRDIADRRRDSPAELSFGESAYQEGKKKRNRRADWDENYEAGAAQTRTEPANAAKILRQIKWTEIWV